MSSDIFIQILIFLFVGFVVAWALASFAELRICRYLYQALAVAVRLISSQDTFDLRILPEVVVTQGHYQHRKAVVRLNVFSSRYMHYRIHIHLLIQPRLRIGVVHEDPLRYRNPSRTIAWTCSFFTPPPYDDILVAFKDLSLEADALEMENT
jgi:hypothetical protein